MHAHNGMIACVHKINIKPSKSTKIEPLDNFYIVSEHITKGNLKQAHKNIL